MFLLISTDFLHRKQVNVQVSTERWRQTQDKAVHEEKVPRTGSKKLSVRGGDLEAQKTGTVFIYFFSQYAICLQPKSDTEEANNS